VPLPSDPADRTPLPQIAWLFLRLGVTAFGGPVAHIAMMEDEVVRRRRWLSREEFLDLLGATHLIPGPNSTEMAIHIGRARAGWRGLLVAGACFIVPATLLVGALAWGYVRFGSVPAVTGLLYGVKPVVIAIILQALWGLGRSALKSWRLAAIGTAALVAAALGANELAVLAAAALLAALPRLAARAPAAGLVAAWAAGGTASGPVAFGLWPLFAVFLKIGAVLFGSGYVLLAFLRTDLVEHLHWLTERQLLDAVAAGQVTPGPLFTTATFVGYVLGGAGGAAVATAGIFLPAFVYVGLSGLLLPRLRGSPAARAALDGVIVGSLALMALVTWQLGRAALVDAPTVALAAASALLLFRWRVSATWLVGGGALAGLLLRGLA
jgi:chromate transporter